MLETMQTNLSEEDSKDIAQNQVDQEDCSLDQSTLESEIEQALTQYTSDQKEIETKTLAKEIIQEQFDLAETSKQSKEKQLADLIVQRADEKAAFELSQTDISNALSAIYNGKKILKQLLQDSSSSVFLQAKKKNKKTLLVEFSNVMRENMVAHSGLRGLMSYFSRIVQNFDLQADQEVVQKVLDLIDLLISKLNEDSLNEAEAENVREKVFGREQMNLQGEISELAIQIGEFQTQIRSLSDDIVNLEQDMKNQSQIQDEKNEQLELKGKSCRNLQNSFEERNKLRFLLRERGVFN